MATTWRKGEEMGVVGGAAMAEKFQKESLKHLNQKFTKQSYVQKKQTESKALRVGAEDNYAGRGGEDDGEVDVPVYGDGDRAATADGALDLGREPGREKRAGERRRVAGEREVEGVIEEREVVRLPFLETSAEGFATRLIRLYGRASMPSHAAATFHKLPAQHKSNMTFNSLLSCYADAGDFDGLTAAFQEIPATYPSIAPTVYSYNVLIHALCQKPDISAALETVLLMEKHGVSPDIITFNTLLNGFCNNGRFDEAETVWEMIKERNLEPDAKCYNAKLRGLVAEGRIDDAAAVLEGLEKDGPKPNTVSYNELIRGYCKAGKLQEAKKLYDDLVKNECAPNKGTYETLLPHLLQAGELDCALTYCYKIFSHKRNLRVECGVLQDVVNALVDESRVEEAAKIVVLGRKKYYPRKGLRMPDGTKVSQLRAETDDEEAISEEECEVEHETEK
ncbi:unnamed protein product [Triticum turgidum subsp. durum]|uniref:Pentacotripeptide-repeat region of PRORP domain-containing protein n=1 Tax=Triticum turgidum subsp. durum TaxID=4567 RepID=A0A9R0VNA5_TRITD|nr:unnamed protein product [Triticum turgidum subsp. durum]